jgi:hypothetical protein
VRESYRESISKTHQGQRRKPQHRIVERSDPISYLNWKEPSVSTPRL